MGGTCQPAVYEDINAEIGDILLFSYGQFHDVFLHNTVALEQSCTFGTNGGTRVGTGSQGNSWDSLYTTQGFRYTLTEAGDFGFSCSRSGNRPGWPFIGSHCAKGQRVIVHVTDPNAPVAGAPQTIEVGGAQGWVVKPQNQPYDDIMATVGDTISFSYSSFYHDVMLVSNDQCDFSSGTLVDDTGSFSWVIPAAGSYTFACTRGDHCGAGNQQVTVIATDAAGAPAPPAPLTAAPVTIEVEINAGNGWVVNAGNAPYPDISANVGDTLSFTYSSSYHDVVRVDNANCDLSAGTVVDETGSFQYVVQASDPAQIIFACGRGSHCVDGQQVAVNVAGTGGGAAAVLCVGDVVADLIVDVNDLLALLGAFGQSGQNNADFNGDMLVDVSDLLSVLAEFGRTC